MLRLASGLFLLISLIVRTVADDAIFQTPITEDSIHAGAFAEWSDGAETKIEEGPAKVLWTDKSASDWGGVPFGATKKAGIRHLRLGWKVPVAAGTVLVRGGGALSVLKADATYPGDLADDSQWIAAERMGTTGITRDEVGGEEYAAWVLPPKTMTRALRFTHTAEASDPKYEGRLGGVLVLGERMVNVAPEATVAVSARSEAADRVNNGTNDGMWNTWNNGEKGGALVVSAEHPEWVVLMWPQAVSLRGLAACWAGFEAAEAQVFAGPEGRHPREATEADWKTIATNSDVKTGYPRELAPNWFAFPEAMKVHAVRLRITKPSKEGHDHLRGKIMDGRGVWLGELLAMQTLGDAPLASALPKTTKRDDDNPPIPVKFTLPEAGVVTLVIEDSTGKRVRNLVADVAFPAGENTAWWDGTDDLGRDVEAARHGLYHIPQQFVAPGSYTVRGIWRKAVDLRFEFSVYSAGQPVWETADKTGAWMTNHAPPTSALFVPGAKSPDGDPRIYLGAYVSEGGHGLQWLRPNGEKLGGQGWVGGVWTGAPTLAVDLGASAVEDAICYVGSVWEGELRITAKTKGEDKSVLKEKVGEDKKDRDQREDVPALEGFDGGDRRFVLAGIAARDGIVVASLVRQEQLVFVDARGGLVLSRVNVKNPRGVAFDAKGRLLVLSGKTLRRHTVHGLPNAPNLDDGEVLIASGLEDPHGITLDAQGRIYISDRGAAHQVKVFSADGKLTAKIGKPGVPAAGAYDERRMNNPNGLAVDGEGNVWVTEDDYQPKRVSVWSGDGKLLRAYYGPGEYGGGGTLDSRDQRRFFYRGMEFALDWKEGTNRLTRVLYRPGHDDADGPNESQSNGVPEQPIYGADGTQYFTNCFDSNPTGGSSVATLWIERDGIAHRCAALGRARDFGVLRREEFRALWPQDVDTKGDYWKNQAVFAWSDLNDDGAVQLAEVTIRKGTVGGVVVQPDLTITVSRLDGAAVRFAPTGFTKGRAPIYDLAKGETLFTDAQAPTSSGGDQVLTTKDGWAISSVAMKPFAPQSLGGALNGEPRWSYPNLWPGLHASHEAPVPDRPGEIIGTTRLLGHLITPGGDSDAGPVFGINGNMGNMYLFTADGLFVAELFKDVRVGRSWSMPVAERGMNLNDISLHDENFWPSMTQTSDGAVYLVDGGRTSLVRVDGLDTIRRIAPRKLTLTAADLEKAGAWLIARETARRAEMGSEKLRVAIRAQAPSVDGALDDWSAAEWADIDKRGTKANFNSDSKPYDVTAAVAIAGDRLFAAFRTGDKDLLKNSGETPNAPFKTGGCLDLMFGANSAPDAKRTEPVAGDCRLLVTLHDGKPRALLYRAVVPGTKEPVPFSSPWRTITLDRVDDVSADVQFAADKNGNYEISIPLTTLGLAGIKSGTVLRGDLGILRGNGFQTLQRVYWSNKATAIVSDVPSEAQLTPSLWGKWEIVGE
ncbi:MAG: hypothetical protein ABI680_00475 [Chthoniobacteraceae bacterium]